MSKPSPLAPVPEDDVEAPAAEGESPNDCQPFSQWACAWSPDKANSPEFYKPFGVLEVQIYKAFSLVAADVNTSDPYCKLQLDGEETGSQTEMRPATLAPVWNQTFNVDIYHPLSVLSIIVMDKDFGTDLGALDMFGLDDDLIGWVDLPIRKLPQNVTIKGWFELCPEEQFRDSLAGRRVPRTDKHTLFCGMVELSITLKVGEPRDEFFALMLPAPDFGEDLPQLDMVELADTLSDLREELRIWQDTLKRLNDAFPKDPWISALVAIALVWNPSFVPAAASLGASALAWKAWHSAVRDQHRVHLIDNPDHDFKLALLHSAQRAAKKAQLHATKLRAQKVVSQELKTTVDEESWNDDGALSQPLLEKQVKKMRRDSQIAAPQIAASIASQGGPGPSPSFSSPASPSSPSSPKRQMGHKRFQAPRLMDREFQARQEENGTSATRPSSTKARTAKEITALARTKSIEEESKQFRDLGHHLTMAQPFITGKDRQDVRRVQKVVTDVTDIAGGVLEFVDQDSHLLLLAVAFTVVTLILVFTRSWIEFTLQIIITVVICVVLLADTVVGRTLQALFRYSKITTHRKPSHLEIGLRKEQAGHHKVNKELAKHLTTHGFQPHVPKQIVVHSEGHAHELVKTTYVEPTWCFGCGQFLWGVRHQGSQCKWCYRNFCKACSKVACDPRGPRSCDVERPPGHEETDGISSFAGSTPVSERSAASGAGRSSWLSAPARSSGSGSAAAAAEAPRKISG